MRQNNKIVKLPKLYDAGGDLLKRWFVFYYYRDPKTGKNKRFRIYDGLDDRSEIRRRKIAADIIEDWTHKLKNGFNPFEQNDVIYQDDLRYRKASEVYKKQKGKIRSVPYMSNLFIQQKKNSVRLSTEHTYRSKLRRLKEFCQNRGMEKNDVSDFNSEHADDFVNYLFTHHNLGKKSVNEYIILMRTLWDYINVILSTQNRQVRNIWKDVKHFKTETRKPKIFNMSQIRKIGKIIEPRDPQLWLMIRLLFNCFIRPNELRFLKINNLYLLEGRIFIPSNISKNKKDSWVDIPEYILDDLYNLGYDKANPNHYVFTALKQPGIKPVSKNYFYKRYCKFRDEAGLPKDMILYALKHTGVAELKKTGADWLEIKNQLRHHSLDQVIEYCYNLLGETSEHIRKNSPQI